MRCDKVDLGILITHITLGGGIVGLAIPTFDCQEKMQFWDFTYFLNVLSGIDTLPCTYSQKF